MKTNYSKLLVIIAASCISLATNSFANDTQKRSDYHELSGQIRDTEHQPLIGATVMLMIDSMTATGAATDADGHFSFSYTGAISNSMTIVVTSIGYQKSILEISDLINLGTINIELTQSIRNIPGISVQPAAKLQTNLISYNRTKLQKRARRSLVPTNIASAFTEPAVSRAGSAHSSQLKVYGSSPMYFYNDLPIGHDPNHYGIFTVLPTTAISETKLTTLGTDASYGLPSVINLTGHRQYSQHKRGSLQLSTIEATANYSVGFGPAFISASLRKSVLDKLVDQFSASSDRQTLPPTNFQDVVFAGGWKLTDKIRLRLDGYHTRDYLAYNTGATTAASVSTRQHSQKRLLAAHLDFLFANAILNISMAGRDHQQEYFAVPDKHKEMFVNLTDSYDATYARAKLKWNFRPWTLTTGIGRESSFNRNLALSQNNWNFLSPFANSDNPYIYQQALNDNYSSFNYSGDSRLTSTYLSMARKLGAFEIETGLRNDNFSSLSDHNALSYRFEFSHKNETSKSSLFIGRFFESPVNQILEPHQVQILAYLNDLKPIKTELVALSHARSGLNLSIFHKQISQRPSLTPNFDQVYNKDGTIHQDFITVESNSCTKLYGGSIQLNLPHLIWNSLNLDLAYGYVKAYQSESGEQVPYDLEAPHQLQLDLSCSVSKKFLLGFKFQVRSGYPYSPTLSTPTGPEDYYSSEFYQSIQNQTNSERFSRHASLNFYGDYTTGRTTFFWAISNLTNRANPIISSSRGYIYDAGILPTAGIRVGI